MHLYYLYNEPTKAQLSTVYYTALYYTAPT